MSPIPTRPSREHCLAVREVLHRVGDKWSVLVVSTLGQGPRRFSELRRLIDGISQRILTLTLKALERDGLLTRTVYPTKASHVEYELTELGRTLLEPIMSLAAWAEQRRSDIEKARVRYDAAEARLKRGDDANGIGPRRGRSLAG